MLQRGLVVEDDRKRSWITGDEIVMRIQNRPKDLWWDLEERGRDWQVIRAWTVANPKNDRGGKASYTAYSGAFAVGCC